MTVAKSDIISRLHAKHPQLTELDVRNCVNLILDAMTESLVAEGGRTEIRGFGAFSTRVRLPRLTRNPKTGEPVISKNKRVPFFKAAKQVKGNLNPEVRTTRVNPGKMELVSQDARKAA